MERISTLDIENGKDAEVKNGENVKDTAADSNNSSYKAITQRVNKILNDKTYISTDDMQTTIVMSAGNCYHENISPTNYNAKRKLYKKINIASLFFFFFINYKFYLDLNFFK